MHAEHTGQKEKYIENFYPTNQEYDINSINCTIHKIGRK